MFFENKNITTRAEKVWIKIHEFLALGRTHHVKAAMNSRDGSRRGWLLVTDRGMVVFLLANDWDSVKNDLAGDPHKTRSQTDVGEKRYLGEKKEDHH